ncbi:MAG: CPBP family intramembrane glutamic endopeptidase [Phycisphaeraceae bacterium]|nr:CPBP family intramembrane glutamic endopeptidase [Phycisphaeraceae bacterium]
MSQRPHHILPPRPSYWEQSRQPLQALIFLLPLILAYEAGLIWIVGLGGPDVMARAMLERLFYSVGIELSSRRLGITISLLPGLLVAAVLLSWHFARKDPWRWRPGLYPLMGGESLLLALPLLTLGLALVRDPAANGAMAAADPETMTWSTKIVLSIGAGLYEELVFRLFAIATIHLLLADVLGVPDVTAAVAAVVGSAVLFGLYHFPSVAEFQWSRMIFFSLAGLYFAGIYLLRGFGVAVAVHAFYDIAVVSLDTIL